ncbi:MAG: divergent polysaccharide deacetylase family protein [Alphaproteobacteria bacterium]|nr:divergent polysaccharide deacetylase family protein [Alphaproteobacteria bacterium]
MKIKKFTIFIFFITAVALAEGAVVLYDVLHPNKDLFEIDSQEFEVPVRKVEVQPFLFETHEAKRVEYILDNVAAEISNNLMKKIYTSGPSSAVKTSNLEKSDSKAADAVVPQKISSDTSALKVPDGSALIAVVIDDVGLSEPFVKDMEKLSKPLTASFLPYGASNQKQAERLKAAGHEVMLHVPMMPHVPADLAPVTLSPEMPKDEVQKDFEAMLDRFGNVGMVGINNHMGSLFTERAKSMGYVMEILKKRGMFFLDSKTSGKSVGKSVSAEYGVPYIDRDVFLDNENKYDYVMGQLKQTEKIAAKHGYAVAIGHPHSQTLRALQDWLQVIETRGFKLVHLSELVKKINKN